MTLLFNKILFPAHGNVHTFEIVLNATFHRLDGKFKTFSIIELNGPDQASWKFYFIEFEIPCVSLRPIFYRPFGQINGGMRNEREKSNFLRCTEFLTACYPMTVDAFPLFYKIMGHNRQCYRTRLGS